VLLGSVTMLGQFVVRITHMHAVQQRSVQWLAAVCVLCSRTIKVG